MKLTLTGNPSAVLRSAALAAGSVLPVPAGCDNAESVSTYSAPKEAPPVAQAADAGGKAADAPIQWKAPEGWKTLPAKEMRYAAFEVSPEHPEVILTVIPLPREANPLLANVRRWQTQVGLPESSEADLPKVATRIEIPPDAAADTVDLQGKDPKTGNPVRMLAAIAPHDDQAWFIKLLGPADVVGKQKEKFDAFIRSIQFHAHDDHAGHAHAPGEPHKEGDGHDHGHDHGPAKDVKLEWTALPEGWAEDKVTQQFRLHTIKVGTGEQAGDLAVTRMSVQQAGPLMDNINRWRRSVGLPDTADPSAHQAKDLTIAGRPGFAIEVKGPEKTVLTGLTEAGRQLWFFKLTGPSALVEAQRGSFESFLRTVRFAGE